MGPGCFLFRISGPDLRTHANARALLTSRFMIFAAICNAAPRSRRYIVTIHPSFTAYLSVICRPSTTFTRNHELSIEAVELLPPGGSNEKEAKPGISVTKRSQTGSAV